MEKKHSTGCLRLIVLLLATSSFSFGRKSHKHRQLRSASCSSRFSFKEINETMRGKHLHIWQIFYCTLGLVGTHWPNYHSKTVEFRCGWTCIRSQSSHVTRDPVSWARDVSRPHALSEECGHTAKQTGYRNKHRENVTLWMGKFPMTVLYNINNTPFITATRNTWFWLVHVR